MAIERTAPEMASMVIWLEKFVSKPNSTQMEPFLNANGTEPSAMIELDRSMKQGFLSCWVSSIFSNIKYLFQFFYFPLAKSIHETIRPKMD